jgi:vesicle coat complex subunit
VKDLKNNDPLIRACAIRNTSSLNLPQLHNVLASFLMIGIRDPDAAVSKASVLAVAKLLIMNPQLRQSSDLIDSLYSLLQSSD